MNLEQQEQFYQIMTRLSANSRAASSSGKDATETIVMKGLIVSKPIASRKKGPEVIDLQEYARSAKAASSVAAPVAGINKIKAINDFIRSNGRV